MEHDPCRSTSPKKKRAISATLIQYPRCHDDPFRISRKINISPRRAKHQKLLILALFYADYIYTSPAVQIDYTQMFYDFAGYSIFHYACVGASACSRTHALHNISRTGRIALESGRTTGTYKLDVFSSRDWHDA